MFISTLCLRERALRMCLKSGHAERHEREFAAYAAMSPSVATLFYLNESSA
jgi:hypothetical protein